MSNWTQVAPQYLTEQEIWCMTVYNDKIYAGTTLRAELLEWNGVDEWTLAADDYAGAEDDLFDIIEYNGALVACTGPLTDDLVQWDDVDTLVKLDDLAERPWSMVEKDGNLYIGDFANGRLWEWDGFNVTEVAPQLDTERIAWLLILDDEIYGIGHWDGQLLKWDGIDEWIVVATQYLSTEMYRGVVYNGKIYAGTKLEGGGGAPLCALLEWNGEDEWNLVAGQPGTETSIWSMVVYNGDLYAGTFPGGKLLRWNREDAWDVVCDTLNAQAYIRSLVIHNGLLYGGTGSGGRLFRVDGLRVGQAIANMV